MVLNNAHGFLMADTTSSEEHEPSSQQFQVGGIAPGDFNSDVVG